MSVINVGNVTRIYDQRSTGKNVDVKILHKRSRKASYTLIRSSEPFFTPLFHIGPSWDPVGQLSRDQSYSELITGRRKDTRNAIDRTVRARWHIDRRVVTHLRWCSMHAEFKLADILRHAFLAALNPLSMPVGLALNALDFLYVRRRASKEEFIEIIEWRW